MRVLVTGARHITPAERSLIVTTLEGLDGISFLMAGDAYGVDKQALEWARDKGIPHACFKACWIYHGKAAGPLRNKSMLDFGCPDLVLAFPGGRGTANMVSQAQSRGFTVRTIKNPPSP